MYLHQVNRPGWDPTGELVLHTLVQERGTELHELSNKQRGLMHERCGIEGPVIDNILKRCP
eukprot:7528815-Prorocentrum_lima.AAC.1